MRLLGLLALVMIAALGGLWFMTRDDASAKSPTASTRKDAPAKTERAAPSTPSPASPSARSGTIIPRTQPKRSPDATGASSGGGAAPAVEAAQDVPAEKPVAWRRTLDEQIGLSEPQLVECVEKSIKQGGKVDGTTAVSFTIAKKPDGKLGVEATGIEYSSIDQATTDCIRDVGKGLTFDALPEGAEKVIAFRKVVVKDGKITENWLTEFANNPHLPAPAN
jgi:hypothetical protein